MKLSFQFGSRDFSFAIGKSGSVSLADWGKGGGSDTTGANLVSPFQQSTWVFSCIGAIAHQLAQIPLRVSKGQRMPTKARNLKWHKRATGEDLVETGPLVELLNRPHPQLTRFDFWYLALAWLMLRGDSFAIPTTADFQVVPLDSPGRRGKLIKRLTIVSPDLIRENVIDSALLAWDYHGSVRDPLPSMSLLAEEVIYTKLANPFNFWRGLSPLGVARLAAQTDYASAQFMKGLMLNNADTGVIVTTDQQPAPEQREAIVAALRERKRKAGTADRPLFLWGGARVDKPSITSADMQFLENRKFNRQEICAIFRVPQEILGFTEDANRSVSDAARLNFLENTISPYCELLEASFEPLARAFDPNYYIWFDVDSLPIMQRARQTRFQTAGNAMQQMGVPLNIVNGLFDLGLPDDLPHGDKVFLPFSLTEYGTQEEQPEPTDTPEPSDDPVNEALRLFRNLGQRAMHTCAVNPAWEESIAASVKLKESKLSRFFFEQRGRVLAKLKAEFAKGLVARGIEDLFNLSDEHAKLLARLKATLITDLEFGGAQLYQEIGAGDFALKPKDAIAFLEKRHPAIQGINETTWSTLKAQLQAGLGEGESFDEIAERVKAVFKDASDSRAGTIALTETTVATNSGRQIGMKAAGVERKGWKTAHLESTRKSHWENEVLSNEQNGIPIDELWPNGCAYPGDPAAEPGETINCRCFGFAVIGEKTAPGKFLQFDSWFAGKAYGAPKGGSQHS
jgi:HK97 family phage portal protein